MKMDAVRDGQSVLCIAFCVECGYGAKLPLQAASLGPGRHVEEVLPRITGTLDGLLHGQGCTHAIDDACRLDLAARIGHALRERA